MDDMPRIVLTTDHSDGVSGTSIFEDGTKMFWTEGRSSDVTFLRGNGYWQEVEAATLDPHFRRYLDAEPDDDTHGRSMTAMEELEWHVARYGRQR